MSLPDKAGLVLGVMEERWACKLYDGRSLLPELEDCILEAGRLTPSSFGLEHWKFVANRPEGPARPRLFEACFSQDAVKTAGLAVAILVRKAHCYDPDSGFVRSRSERFPGGHPVFRADFSGYYDFLKAEGRLEEWARSQAYLACANMMTAAAAAGVESCAIEGYREESVLAALGADPLEWRVGIVTVFGHAAEPRREKIREPLEKLVEYR
jgi:nitroreductase